MLNKKELKFEYMRGTGAGGQHRNKTSSCVRVTHVPTGISVVIDERSQHHSKRKAIIELEQRLKQLKQSQQSKAKKHRRDLAIKTRNIIRTYDYKTGLVRDHRTGKTAPLKDILIKGKLDLLYDTNSQ